jgi:hypothetical protein
MKGITIERTCADIPSLVHRRIEALQCRLLFGRQDPPLVHRGEAGDGDTIAGDDEGSSPASTSRIQRAKDWFASRRVRVLVVMAQK